MTIGYCVKCRDKREMQGPSAITMKNGKPAVKGTCPTCSFINHMLFGFNLSWICARINFALSLFSNDSVLASKIVSIS